MRGATRCFSHPRLIPTDCLYVSARSPCMASFLQRQVALNHALIFAFEQCLTNIAAETSLVTSSAPPSNIGLSISLNLVSDGKDCTRCLVGHGAVDAKIKFEPGLH